jgi:hypothetical protein
MHPIGDDTATADPQGEFTEGDPQQAIPATDVRARWLNAVQRELIELLTRAGIAPDALQSDQVWAALQALFVLKAGDTVAGSLAAAQPLDIIGTGAGAANVCIMRLLEADGATRKGYVGEPAGADDIFLVADTPGANVNLWPGPGGEARVGSNTLWHAGNDGVGSGLDADLLQGQPLSALQQTPPAVAGYDTVGALQINNTLGAAEPIFTLHSITPSAAWSTMGRTGSGATYIWNTLDQVPVSAKALLLRTNVTSVISAPAVGLAVRTLTYGFCAPAAGSPLIGRAAKTQVRAELIAAAVGDRASDTTSGEITVPWDGDRFQVLADLNSTNANEVLTFATAQLVGWYL